MRGQIARVKPDKEAGLTSAQVEERRNAGWSNAVTDKNDKSPAQIVFKNVFTFFNTILFSIAVIFAVFIVYLYSTGNAAVVDKHFGFSKFLFLIPAVMNVTIGTIQELHSRRIIKSLRIVSEVRCRVLRDKEAQTIHARDLVIDDVVLLGAGDQASADLILLSGEVSVDESMLTGESDYIKKLPGDTILSGSSVILGEGRACVTEVGNDTYASGLSSKVKSIDGHKSELMQTIFKIIRALAVALVVVEAAVIGTLIYKISVNGGNADIFDGMTLSLSDPVSWARIMITGGSFGVGVIPSGLVLTTSVTLMLSSVALSRKQTLIQELYSLENLSRVDVICLDKTGTLTDGTMNVVDVKLYAHLEEVEAHVRALMAAAENRNQTAEALYKRFGKAEKPAHKEVIPFSSAVKSSGIVYEDGKKLLLGAPEYLLPAGDGRLSFVTEQAKEGRRVLAMTLNEELLCFFVIEDHIRESASGTLKFFAENGVTVKIISGDNPLTVSKIAEQCGVKDADKHISLEGVPLERIPDLVEDYTVFARVSPDQKEALVAALQAKGHKVAMTGDGVNDILALRRSDSSITFAKATEAAKSCSDVVLLDNDFSHLQDVVGEGRRVIGNVQRTSVLFLMKSIAFIVLSFALIPFAKGQMWFSIENAYMLEAAVIGLGGFLLSLEYQRRPVRGAFLSNICLKALAAGGLAAAAILLPVMVYTIPVYFGAAPLIRAENIRSLMTILLALAGIVVIFVMCMPFNRYRAFTLCAVIFTATFLGLMLPTSYIGGQPTGAGMFAFDSSAGQTFSDCIFMREFFKPWNSAVIRNLMSDPTVYQICKIFVFSSVPLFVIIIDLINYKIEGTLGRRSLFTRERVGKLTLLICGSVLLLDSLFDLVETGVSIARLPAHMKTPVIIAAAILFALGSLILNFFVALSAVRVWKTGKRRYVNRASVLGFILLALAIGANALTMIFDGKPSFAGETALESVNTLFVDVFITLLYFLGALAVRLSQKTKAPAPSPGSLPA